MGLLLDTVYDAWRPLPTGALVLRRSAAADHDLPSEDVGSSADPGAFTVYRLQKEGGSPPVAPLQGPSTLGQGAPHGATGPEGVVNSIVHPLVSRKDGLERGEKITREVHAQDVLSNRRLESSSVSPGLSGAQSPEFSASVSSLIATSDEEAVPAVTNAPAQRRYGKIGGSQVAPGAPSEDLAGKPAQGAAVRVAAAAVVEAIDAIGETAPVDALNGIAAIGNIQSQAVTTRRVSRADRAMPDAGTARAVPAQVQAQVYAQPQPRSQPASRVQAPTTASGPRATTRADPPAAAGLHIGRIDVTVLAQAPRPAPAAPASPLLDSQFLSRNYLRRT